MTTEALPEQEPTLDPEKTGRGGTENFPSARRPMFLLSRRALLKRFAYGLAALFTTVPGVLSVILYLQVNNMDIRIHSLEAALRSGQLSQLSSSVASLEKHVAEQDERFALKESVVSGMRTLGKTLDGQISDQNQKVEQLESKIDEQKRALQYELDGRQARALDFSSLKASFETLKASLVEKNPAASSGHAVSSEKKHKTTPAKKSHRSARTVPLVAPFILTGIEQRGGQTFAVVAPRGATTLSQMRLLSPGDSAWGWKLRRLEGNEALFSVNGIPQRISAQ